MFATHFAPRLSSSRASRHCASLAFAPIARPKATAVAFASPMARSGAPLAGPKACGPETLPCCQGTKGTNKNRNPAFCFGNLPVPKVDVIGRFPQVCSQFGRSAGVLGLSLCLSPWDGCYRSPSLFYWPAQGKPPAPLGRPGKPNEDSLGSWMQGRARLPFQSSFVLGECIFLENPLRARLRIQQHMQVNPTSIPQPRKPNSQTCPEAGHHDILPLYTLGPCAKAFAHGASRNPPRVLDSPPVDAA